MEKYSLNQNQAKVPETPIDFNMRIFGGSIEYAHSLLARDWRGPGTGSELSNGVLVNDKYNNG